MLAATAGRVASITGRDRSESTWSPCQSLCPPLAAVTFRSSLVTRSTAWQARKIVPGRVAAGSGGLIHPVERARATSAERGKILSTALSMPVIGACRTSVGPIGGPDPGGNEMAQYLILIYEDETQYAT